MFQESSPRCQARQCSGRIKSQQEPRPGSLTRAALLRAVCPGSQQQADPALLLPLCLLQGTEGHLGSFPEDIFHILPKLGGTFQVERSSHLFTGTHALGGMGEAVLVRRGPDAS